MTLTEHAITVTPKSKMDTPRGLYTWTCSCGRRSDGLFGSERRADQAGRAHADSKRRSDG